MYSMNAQVQKAHAQNLSNLYSQIPQAHLQLVQIYNPRVATPSTSNQYIVAYPNGVCPQYPPQSTAKSQKRLNGAETAPQSNDLEVICKRLESTTFALRSEEITVKRQAKEIEMLRNSNNHLIKQNIDLTVKAENASKALVEKTKVIDEQNLEIVDFKNKNDSLQKRNEDLNNQIIDLTFKLGESQAKQRTLKTQEEELNSQLEEISKRLDSSIIALKTEEHIAKLQAKEIEKLKETTDQMNKKYLVLNAEAQKALRAFNDNSRLDSYLKELFENALKNVLLDNDKIIESLTGIQTDQEEKNNLMTDQNETLQSLDEQELMNQRIRELEEQRKLDENLERFEFDFRDDSS